MEKALNETRENIPVSVQIASPEDWAKYRDIITEAFSTRPDAFSQGQLDSVLSRSDEQWKKGFESNTNSFAVLVKVNSEAIGAVGARKTKIEGVWFGTSLYLSPKYKIDRFSVVKQMGDKVIEELKKIGAKKVILYFKQGDGRERIQTIYERFGFQALDSEHKGYTYMEKDIV